MFAAPPTSSSSPAPSAVAAALSGTPALPMQHDVTAPARGPGDQHVAQPSGRDEVDHDLWLRALGRLRDLSGRAAVDAWLVKACIRQVQQVGFGQIAVTLGAPDSQVCEFIEAHYLAAVQAALAAELDAHVSVSIAVTQSSTWTQSSAGADAAARYHRLAAQPASAALPDPALSGRDFRQQSLWDSNAQEQAAPPGQSGPGGRHNSADWQDLAARFSFDRFVVGTANELAHSAARAVAEDPAVHYNPLFLHGGVGLGKTHLLHAIGQLARLRRPGLRVRYVAAETYIDDTYSAWRSRDASVRGDVRAHYRDNVDLLLVDDVQFLQANDKIGEEFFHLFNALHQAGRQIVLSCDRFPSELQSLHERLRSRFEWGLVAELAPPDRDLRIAILQRNAHELGLALPHDVVLYLADHLRNNVRELEGALNKLSAHARIGRRGVDLAMARSVLGPVIEMPTRNLTAEVIQRVTAQHFGIKITDLKGQKRHRTVVVPRMIAMSLIRKHTGASFPEIGRMFGGRDHSTVMHACHKIAFETASDLAVQSAVQAIETALGK